MIKVRLLYSQGLPPVLVGLLTVPKIV